MKEQNKLIAYIASIVAGICIFVGIFYIGGYLLSAVLFTFFIVCAILQKSLKKSINKFVYIMPYFLGIFILQAITPRGEFYNLFGIKLDKTGVDFTILYFIRLMTLLYFLQIFFFIIKRIPAPNNKIYNELFRVMIFMKVVRKSFFLELGIIRKINGSFMNKLKSVTYLIDNVYKSSFKNYPYDDYIVRLRK